MEITRGEGTDLRVRGDPVVRPGLELVDDLGALCSLPQALLVGDDTQQRDVGDQVAMPFGECDPGVDDTNPRPVRAVDQPLRDGDDIVVFQPRPVKGARRRRPSRPRRSASGTRGRRWWIC
jgi:hypothetical protein